MSNRLITHYCVDIYNHPTSLAEKNGEKEVTIGDLHANAMLLLFFLVTHRVVSIKPEEYQLLKSIYIKDVNRLTKTDIATFNRIIDNLEINNLAPLVRLIGDELCDRGQNDYFILKIFNRLKKSQVKMEIIFSNHGSEFLIPLERKEALHAPNINFNGQADSLNNMTTLLEKGIIAQSEVDKLIEESYLPNLKLLSYSLDADNITIYSHAGIGLNTIESLAKHLDIAAGYKDSTKEELAATVDAINAKFYEHIKNHTVHQLLEDIRDRANPIITTIWNRYYEDLVRPIHHKNYGVFFVHGHDSKDPNPPNVFNLDHKLGKQLHANIGSFSVLQSGITAPLLTNEHQSEDKHPKTQAQEAYRKKNASNKFIQEVLTPLNLKMEDLNRHNLFKKSKEQKGVDALNTLKLQLIKTWKKYLDEHSTDPKAYDHFKASCKSHLDTAHIELDKHRGWSEFLINLLLTITVVGIILKGIINKINHKPFFFVHKTESEKILNRIEEHINDTPEDRGSFVIS